VKKIVAALAISALALTACSSGSDAPSDHKLSHAEFDAQLRDAGWEVGDNAYTMGMALCVSAKTDPTVQGSAEQLARFARSGKDDTPEQMTRLVDAYWSAITATC
jgi:hypothetical protein